MQSKIFKGVEIKILTTSSYIKVGENAAGIPNFTEEEIKVIGNAWTENLLEKQSRGVIS